MSTLSALPAHDFMNLLRQCDNEFFALMVTIDRVDLNLATKCIGVNNAIEMWATLSMDNNLDKSYSYLAKWVKNCHKRTHGFEQEGYDAVLNLMRSMSITD